MDQDFLSSIRGPTIVGFEVTPHCNRRCVHCEPAKVTKDDYYLRRELSTREVISIIDKLGEAEVHFVFLTGGEPSLRTDLDIIVDRCFRREVLPNLLTTAEKVDRRFTRQLHDLGLENVQISLEGPEQVHDGICRTRDAFRKTVEGIQAFVEGGLNVYVTSVAMRQNLQYLPGLIPVLADMGVYGYGTVRLRAHRTEDLAFFPTKGMLLTCNARIVEACKDHGVELLKLFGGLGISSQEIPQTHYPSAFVCNAGKIKMEILGNGDVVPCKSFRRPDFVVGNLLRDRVEDVWDHDLMKLFRKMTPADYRGQCGSCQLKAACHCCRAVAYNITGDLLGSDPSCYMVNPQLAV